MKIKAASILWDIPQHKRSKEASASIFILKLITLMYFAAKMLSVGLSILLCAMFLRAILPFFVNPEENKLYFFLLVITEPFVLPVRFIMEKIGIGQNTPIDLSFTVAYLFYWIMQMILPAV